MDSKTKSAIKSLVLDLRHTLEDELAIALRHYGIFTDRDWSLEAPPDRLTDPADREMWRRIVTVINQGMQEGRTLQEASHDYVRESAFTFLNRLVGLKCLEVRGIIDEVITTRDIYGGRSKVHRDYRDEHPTEARAADDALPACLESVWRRVDDELIGYLFDPDDDYTLVWPRYAVLKDCIAKINDLEEAAWAEDEIIGWIYQFYNAREKEAIRSRGKPQTPHDVAVINQFFTPRWIVKFLVDNTLGRLWLEMHPGSTRVREKCDYLVPEPLADEEGQGKGTEGDGKGKFQLDPHSPINNPEADPRREEKPLPQIKLLDPACGTMHFGHYAMEVFEAMYRDARDWGHLRVEDPEIPGVILENNLFGVDIDRRAVQLAALSLFMKARTMHPEARMQQVNLVAADATLPDSDVREKFLERYGRTPKVQEAFAEVLDDMDQVAELGSLLRVEERLRELLSDVGDVGRKHDLKALDPRRQRDLPGMEPPVRQMGLADLADDEEEAAAWTPQYTLRELREDLRAFAHRALDEHDLNAQLFATEADKAVRLLDVLMADYDVIVMNPPYGDITSTGEEYVSSVFKDTKSNVYATFVDRFLEQLTADGYLGALTSRTFLLLTSFKRFRENVILGQAQLHAMVDLGWEVLDDAQTETTAYVLSRDMEPVTISSVFFRLIDQSQKEGVFQQQLQALQESRLSDLTYVLNPSDFLLVPRSPLSYWVPSRLRQLFVELPSIDPYAADIREGLGSSDSKRFYRYRWEVPPRKVGPSLKWVPFAHGGQFSPFYRDIDRAVDWEDEGAEMKQDIIDRYPYLDGNYGWKIKYEEFYFRPGLTWGKRTNHFNVQLMPEGCIFSNEGNAIFAKESTQDRYLLGLLNAHLLSYLINMICSLHKVAGYVARLPYADPSARTFSCVSTIAKQAHDIKANWDTGNETSTRFTRPWLLQVTRSGRQANPEGIERLLELLGDERPEVVLPQASTLEGLVETVRTIEEAADACLERLQAQIDQEIYDLYEISVGDQQLIERELEDRPSPVVWPEMRDNSDRTKREQHVKRFFYYFACQAVREDEDGIVPLAGCAGQEPYLMDRVRAKLEETFGPSTAYELEQEAPHYIGRDLETQMHTYFFHHFHVDLYKKRPILWHLTSDKKHFAVMLDYHRLDRDTLLKVRSQYLWPQMESVRTRLAAARAQEAVATIAELEEELEDLKDFDERLESVIQGTVKVKPPKWANGPYRNGEPPYDPDLNDGVKVNLLPIQKARLLPVKQVL